MNKDDPMTSNLLSFCSSDSLDGDLARGDLGRATGWLRDHVQQFGGLYEPAVVIEKAAGFAPNEAPLLSYLEAKFRNLYRV